MVWKTRARRSHALHVSHQYVGKRDCLETEVCYARAERYVVDPPPLCKPSSSIYISLFLKLLEDFVPIFGAASLALGVIDHSSDKL